MKSLAHWRRLTSPVSRSFAAAAGHKNVDVEGWLTTLQSKAQTSEGKSLSLQLASLVQYYNRKFEESAKANIDWEDWKKRIQTKNLVDRIKSNVESIVSETYSKKEVKTKAKEAPSAHEEAINKELLYFRTLWSNFYEDNLNQHCSLKFIPRLSDLGPLERFDLFPADNMEASRLIETMAIVPWAFEDTPYAAYTLNQFAWGRRIATFYRHPCDDFRGVKGTRTIMGR